jgi:hypothetical protein
MKNPFMNFIKYLIINVLDEYIPKSKKMIFA